jgi:hypothetical protein
MLSSQLLLLPWPAAPVLLTPPGTTRAQQVQDKDRSGDEEQAHVDATLQPPDQTHRPGFYVRAVTTTG